MAAAITSLLRQVRVFTFSVGQHNYDVTPLQWMACTNKGTSLHFTARASACYDLLSAVHPYVQLFVTHGLSVLPYRWPSIALSVWWAVLLVHLTEHVSAHLAVCPLSICPAFLLLHLFADHSISLCMWVNSECY